MIQFRSETDEREEYITLTSQTAEEWHELALPGFAVTAAVVLGSVVHGHLAYFLEPKEHRYWLREEYDAADKSEG